MLGRPNSDDSDKALPPTHAETQKPSAPKISEPNMDDDLPF